VWLKNKILIAFLLLVFSINKFLYTAYGDNAVYVNGVNTIYVNENRVNLDPMGKEMNSYFDHIKKNFYRIKKDFFYYKIIIFCSTIYFLMASYYDKIAKQIIDSDFYFFFTETNQDELEQLLIKISNTADFDFIVKMKKIKKDINFLFNYRYWIYFFVVIPFFHGNIKRVMFNINSLDNGIKMLYNLIIQKQ
jgi:hypothetical protein